MSRTDSGAQTRVASSSATDSPNIPFFSAVGLRCMHGLLALREASDDRVLPHWCIVIVLAGPFYPFLFGVLPSTAQCSGSFPEITRLTKQSGTHHRFVCSRCVLVLVLQRGRAATMMPSSILPAKRSAAERQRKRVSFCETAKVRYYHPRSDAACRR